MPLYSWSQKEEHSFNDTSFLFFYQNNKNVDTEFFDFKLDAITESNRTKKQSSEVFLSG